MPFEKHILSLAAVIAAMKTAISWLGVPTTLSPGDNPPTETIAIATGVLPSIETKYVHGPMLPGVTTLPIEGDGVASTYPSHPTVTERTIIVRTISFVFEIEMNLIVLFLFSSFGFSVLADTVHTGSNITRATS